MEIEEGSSLINLWEGVKLAETNLMLGSGSWRLLEVCLVSQFIPSFLV